MIETFVIAVACNDYEGLDMWPSRSFKKPSSITYWVQGNSSGALELLDECIARHYLHSHPALRGLGLQATVDLSI
ncbi:MAG: hypothetical protein WBD20_13000, partial [Pirellulaceae bacterium]